MCTNLRPTLSTPHSFHRDVEGTDVQAAVVALVWTLLKEEENRRYAGDIPEHLRLFEGRTNFTEHLVQRCEHLLIAVG